MIQALLQQLSIQLQDGPADLMEQDVTFLPGKPSSKVLLDFLQRLVRRFSHVYIFLDALDESPRNASREHVLEVLEMMQKWGMRQLHLFVTSRDEPDIRECFSHLATQHISMRNAGIDKDIISFISGRLIEDRKLRKLLLYRDKIQEALVNRARGV